MNANGSPATAGSSTGPALFLWVLVICALAYGVVETATKVPALFGA
jgi:hypothetical protein